MIRRSGSALRTGLGLLLAIVVLAGASCGPGRIVSIGAGNDFACVLHDGGQVGCWGRNDVGQLGRGTSDTLAHPEAARVALAERAVALSVGRDHACALTKEGIAFCWGDDRMSEIGATAPAERCSDVGMSIPCRTRPTAVASDQRFRSIAAGFRQSCGITIEQRILCWGDAFAADDDRDTLGLDRCGPRGYDAWCRRRPAMIPILTSSQGSKPYLAAFDTLAIGAFASCGVARGYTYCWGHGTRLQWSPGTESSVFGTGIRQVTVGEEHACGIGYDTVTVCWGTPRLEALGRADSSAPPPRGYEQKAFRPIDDPIRFAALSVGDLHTCGIEALTGRLSCWGANQYGQLGVGSTDQRPDSVSIVLRPRPTPVVGDLRFAQVAAGLEHTCALAADGSVYCWGRALRGSLGTELRSSAAPVRVLGP